MKDDKLKQVVERELDKIDKATEAIDNAQCGCLGGFHTDEIDDAVNRIREFMKTRKEHPNF